MTCTGMGIDGSVTYAGGSGSALSAGTPPSSSGAPGTGSATGSGRRLFISSSALCADCAAALS